MKLSSSRFRLSPRITIASVFLALIGILSSPATGHAHPLSSTYLNISIDKEKIRTEINIPLTWVLDFKSSEKPEEIGKALARKSQEISSFVLDNLSFSSNGSECSKTPESTELTYFPDGPYYTLFFNIDCGLLPEKISLRYNLYFDQALNHPAFVKVKDNNTAEQAYVLTRDEPEQIINLRKPSGWQQFREFVRLGIKHIFLGFDHILFIILLLLPAVLKKPIWKRSLIVISSFTLAHSATLSLAALKIITLPARFSESAIALSIIVAALANLFFLLKKDGWLIAFVFGLVHGFGFASVLSAYGLSTGRLIKGLLGFNIGVEIGQLAMAAVLIPSFYFLHKHPLYRRFVVPGISAVSACIALIWLIERSLAIEIFNRLF